MKREMPDAAMIQSSEAIENVVKTNGDNHVIFMSYWVEVRRRKFARFADFTD